MMKLATAINPGVIPAGLYISALALSRERSMAQEAPAGVPLRGDQYI
jgi:hypothetical protein